jgi:hypothetical protein
MNDYDARFAKHANRLFRQAPAILAASLCIGLFPYLADGQQSGQSQSTDGQQQTQPTPGQEETQPDTGKQVPLPIGLPARAPGYELYYHNENHALAFATRWGYFDGWRDGKHDSELGVRKLPTDQDRYKMVPDHGLHPGIPRTEYKTAYRTAYLHGYDHAVKIVNGTESQPQ